MPTNPSPNDPQNSPIARLIDWSVANRLLVLLLAVALAFFGLLSVARMPLDALPDLSDTQVIIRTEFPGQSPQVVEDTLTYPLSSAMLGLPKTKDVRGVSMFGSSFVYVVFQDGTDQYWARSRVLEALARIQGDLPANPKLGPDATGVGWVYQYALVDRTGNHSLADLRSLQDWFLKLELGSVEGVAEVASAGGFVREYQVLVNPHRLRYYAIAPHDIARTLENVGTDGGGRVIEQGEAELMVRLKGYATRLEDIKNLPLRAKDGAPVTLGDVARVVEGAALRRGVTEFDGEGEAVGGIVVMRSGENALDVINRVKQRLSDLKPGLPEGVEVVPVYDRAPLIKGAVVYLAETLTKEMIIVALVLFIFLLHMRAALVALLVLPLGVLGAFIIMAAQGITANILSLGGIAIAIGTMVDASIVMVENAGRKLAALKHGASKSKRQAAVLAAAKEVGPGLFFSLLIIAVSFLPVLALEGESYRLFSQLAFTKTYVLLVATLLSVTLLPVLMVLLFSSKKAGFKPAAGNPVNRWLLRHYTPALQYTFRQPKKVLLICVLLVLSAAWPLWRTGAEFMPPLDEGEILYMPSTLPGVSVTEAKDILSRTNRLIKTLPEVAQVFGKAGRSDSATDPAPLTMIETWIDLKPKDQWRGGMTTEKLIEELDSTVSLPGLVNSWGYPIKIRTDMISTGIRTPIGVKVLGDNIADIADAAMAVEGALGPLRGVRSVFAERLEGGKYLEITPNRENLARQGVSVEMLRAAIATSLGGVKLAESVQGRERYPITMRYDRPFRQNIADVENTLIPTSGGALVPLKELAKVAYNEAPPMLRSENARLNGWVFVDIEGRDIAGFVKEAKATVAQNADLPAGTSLVWTGQFEQMQKANKQLMVAVPMALLAIFVLLMLAFGRVDRTVMVMTALPVALVGGMWAVYLAGYFMSVAVAVGFIALAGLAVETMAIMIIYLDGQVRETKPKTAKELAESIQEGALLRLRPLLMTIITEFAALMPLFVFTGLGADVMRRIALPMIGGMATTAVLTLLLTPTIYYLWEKRKL